MLSAAIVVLAISATAAPPVTHDVWGADIALSDASPIYLLQLDNELDYAIKGLGPEWVEVVDAQGRTMPRGFWNASREGPHRDVTLALTHKREQRVQPHICEQHKRPTECALFDSDPDFAASQTRMAQRLLEFGASNSSIAGFGSNSSVRGPKQELASPPAPAMPLRYDVVDTALPPADAGVWMHRTLVLKWKSHLPPAAVAWQIGYNVAEVTPGDDAILGDDGVSLAYWNWALLHVWRRAGRMLVFATLNSTQNNDGSWQIEIPLKGLVGDTALQIASAPVGAVDLVDVHLTGMAPLTSPPVIDVARSMQISALDERHWKVVSAWPKSVASATIRFTFEQSLAIMDSRIATIEYQMKTASGRVSTSTIRAFQTFGSENAFGGINGSLPVDANDPWIELIQISPAQPLPEPQLTAAYRTQAIWFDNVGTPPYRLTIGAKSTRRPDQIGKVESERLGGANTIPTSTVQLPIATVRNTRKMRTFTEPTATSTASESQTSSDSHLAAMITLIAMLAITILAAFDYSIRLKIAELRGDEQ